MKNFPPSVGDMKAWNNNNNKNKNNNSEYEFYLCRVWRDLNVTVLIL